MTGTLSSSPARGVSEDGAQVPYRIRFAVAAMVTASALFAATTLIAKVLGRPLGPTEPLHPFMVSAGRFVFALAALAAAMALRPRLRPTLAGARYDRHLARSVCGWLGVTALFAASARMPLAEATAISFLSPLVTIGLAILLLGERAAPRKALAALLALAGALALLRPGAEAFQPAALLALLSALLLGVEAVFIKRLSDTEPPQRILLINNTIGATVSLAAAALVWTAPSTGQWLLLATLGAVMVTGQAFFIQSMKNGPASVVIPVLYSTLVFAALFDLALFGVRPGLAAVIGALLIVAGAWLLSNTDERRADG